MTGAADGPQVPARLTHLPHSHVSNLGRNQPSDEQRAAPVPGVLQAAVRLHPALPVPFQPVLSKQGLDLLGARVVPGPHGLLLKGEAEVEGHWGQTELSHPTPLPPVPGEAQRPERRQPLHPEAATSRKAPGPQPPRAGPTHLAIVDSSSPHAQAEGSDKGQGADAVCGQVAFQQTPEPTEKCMEAQVPKRALQRPELTLMTLSFPAPLTK